MKRKLYGSRIKNDARVHIYITRIIIYSLIIMLRCNSICLQNYIKLYNIYISSHNNAAWKNCRPCRDEKG